MGGVLEKIVVSGQWLGRSYGDSKELSGIDCVAESDGLIEGIYGVPVLFPKRNCMTRLLRFDERVFQSRQISPKVNRGTAPESSDNSRELQEVPFAELETLLLISKEMNYLSPDNSVSLMNDCDELSKFLSGLLWSLATRH